MCVASHSRELWRQLLSRNLDVGHEWALPIRQFLDGRASDREHIESHREHEHGPCQGVDHARSEGQEHDLTIVVAKEIIELAKAGERKRLKAEALKSLRSEAARRLNSISIAANERNDRIRARCCRIIPVFLWQVALRGPGAPTPGPRCFVVPCSSHIAAAYKVPLDSPHFDAF